MYSEASLGDRLPVTPLRWSESEVLMAPPYSSLGPGLRRGQTGPRAWLKEPVDPGHGSVQAQVALTKQLTARRHLFLTTSTKFKVDRSTYIFFFSYELTVSSAG